MNKARIIINPIAGTKSKKGIGSLVKQVLVEGGWSVDMHLTAGAGHAERLAREAASLGYHAVISIGGDGTVNEIASALCGSDSVLGIVPCGSGNGLARHLGISLNVRKAAETILKNTPLKIDYAEVNGKKFFCTCGFGFDAVVSDIFAHKHRRGLLSYLQSVVESFPSYTPQRYSLLINGKEISVTALFIAVCNASQYGNNVYISPKASISDGLLDVTIIRSGNLLEMLHVGVDLLRSRIDRNLSIQTFRCESLKIVREDKGLMHLDGEPVEADREFSINCVDGALNVFV